MIREKCDECGGKLIVRKTLFKVGGISLGRFPAEVCTKCGEKCFDEKASKAIDLEAKKKGLWGLGRRDMVMEVIN